MPKRIGLQKQRARNFIKEWREFRGLTQEQLAERLDCSPASISRLERGKQALTDDVKTVVAKALDIEPSSIDMRNPAESEIWTLWDRATPAKKRQIVELAQIVLKTGTDE